MTLPINLIELNGLHVSFFDLLDEYVIKNLIRYTFLSI